MPHLQHISSAQPALQLHSSSALWYPCLPLSPGNMLRIAAAVVLLGTLCASRPLSTDSGELRAAFHGMLSELDTDSDGRITLAEFLPLWGPSQPQFGDPEFSAEFSALDLDGDGGVTEGEFVRAASQPAPPQLVPLGFRSADVDGDGRLSEAEADQVASALNLADSEHVQYAVHHADADGDGQIELAEFVDATEELRRGGS